MKGFFQSLLSEKRIAGGALILAVTQLLASVFGLLRDRAFSVMFPLDSDPIGVASVYIAAFRPSDLLFQVLVMSCLSVVVVPFLAGHLAHDRREEVNKLLTSTMLVFGLAFGALALLLAIFLPIVAPYFVQFTGETLELYILFGRAALLTNFFFVFGNALGQYLIAKQRYWMYGITPIVWALGTIAGTYLLTPWIGPMGPMIGTIIGSVAYLFLRAIDVVRSGYRVKLEAGGVLHADLKHMGVLIVPRMAALGALRLQFLLLDRLASGLGTSMVALNQFASNFESVIPGIVGIAIAQSTFSLMSQAAAKNDVPLLREQIKKALAYNVSLSLLGAVGLVVCSGIAATLIHLQAESIPTFMHLLLIYALAIPFESTNYIILRSFYSLKNTGWPAVSSVLSVLLAVLTGTALAPSFGISALAVAYVVGQGTQTLLLGSILYIRIRPASAFSIRHS